MVGFITSVGANLGLILGSFWPSLMVPAKHVHLMYPLTSKLSYILQETGYLHLQATKPDTVGKLLNPTGRM